MGFPISTELNLDPSREESRRLGAFSEHGAGVAGMAGSAGSVGSVGAVGTVGTVGTGTAAMTGRSRVVAGITVAPVELGFGRGSRWIAVAGGLGYFPVAPGTAGSLGGVLLFLLAMNHGVGFSRGSFFLLYLLAVGLLFILGTRAAGRAEVDFGRRDDGRIVIDEVLGQLIALIPLTFFVGNDLSLIFPQVVTGFVLFRLFDVWKPGAVGWAERRFKGGLGVMADDVVAGLYAGICLAVGLIVLQLFGIGTGVGTGVGIGVGIGTEIGVVFENWMQFARSLSSIESRAWA